MEWVAPRGVGGQEEFHALQIAGGVADAPPHVATADPPRFWGHADAVALFVIADHRSHSVRAVSIFVVRNRLVVPRVVPAVVMVSLTGCRIPSPIAVLQGRVLPVIASVLPPDHDALTPKTQVPHGVRPYLADVPFNAVALPALTLHVGQDAHSGVYGIGAHVGVRHHAGHARQVSEVPGPPTVPIHPDDVLKVVSPVGKPLRLQPGPDGGLASIGSVHQRLVHEGPASRRIVDLGRAAQVSLLFHQDDETVIVKAGLAGHHPGA